MTLTLYNPSVTAAAESGEIQRNQCFVGEILQIGLSVNSTKLAVKDQDGNNLRISFTFPPDTYDKECIPLSVLKRGLTILILTASIEDLPGGGKGIKVLDPRLVKVNISPLQLAYEKMTLTTTLSGMPEDPPVSHVLSP
ncbi:uncharacterized protein BDW70DRAFT_159947 [Aspergillus foveolatus]|uniref:uncharacterized protein n=1 Tax=Aspergillus foveolatus TaxID=210207 RepID=UPI003CCDFE81